MKYSDINVSMTLKMMAYLTNDNNFIIINNL